MKNIDTKCVQAGYAPEKTGDARVLPIYNSTTYYYATPEELADAFDLKIPTHMYSRISNPTVGSFEAKIADLEGGAAALATSSGQSALLITILNVCNAGDHIVASSAIYGGSYNLLGYTLKRLGIETTFVDPDCSEAELNSAIKPNTKILYAETIANPAMIVIDFEKFSNVAKANKVLFVIDNTLATPCLCRPIEFGANIVTHSTTKYIDGHARHVGGVIVDAGNFEYVGNERYAQFNTPDESYHGLVYSRDCGNLAFIMKARVQLMRDLGVCQSPQTAFDLATSLETLHLRMRKHSDNALAVAKALKGHAKIDFVKHPLLEGDKYSDLGKKYLPNGTGGMLSIGIKGDTDAVFRFLKSLKLIKIVTHIADSRSCVLHPATTTHRQLSDKALADCGIEKNLVRLSLGLEDEKDLVEDVLNALKNV